MPKVKISEYSATANSNTDVASINIDEGCAPSGINNAIRAVMGHLKDFQQGTNGDPFNGPVNGTVGATTPNTGAFTTLSASSTVTLSGGTANGVAYLNDSKALTTGSALVFDGTNLGIGSTTSLSTKGKLGVYATGDQTEEGTAAATIGSWDSGGMRLYFGVNNTNEYTYIGSVKSATGYRNLVLQPNGGNLGLGVTPSAWGTAWRSLDMFGWGSVASASDNMNVLNNAYITASGSVYKNTGLATRYNQSGGVHSWFNAASGTAGNAITFTQAMTLNASGQLMVGSTSSFGVVNGEISVKAASGGAGVALWDAGVSSKFQLIAGAGGVNAFGLYDISASAYRWTVDASGNLGIGNTDPTNNGASGYNNLVIGNSSSSTCGLTFKTVSTGTPLPGIAWSRGAGSGANGKVYYDQSTDRLYCQAGGSGGVYLAGGGTSWTSASDERVKDIIEPIENATQKLANWRTVIGKYKSDTDGVRRSFLIAQDVLTTFPEAVNTDKAEEYGLNYQDLIPLLVASIQELKAEFDAYKASHS